MIKINVDTIVKSPIESESGFKNTAYAVAELIDNSIQQVLGKIKT